ncbi:MAG: type II toxin-antitoxin system HicB family antitoxin [Desulfovibrionaceae bacterium]|jgi:predicted transcriptional regulator|nr:type II toxin-antitoxin system HicB family antitoxin [Desulfovibrionaceae bacterium]
MSQLALRLPDSLHQRARALAEQDNTSLNQFIALAVAEKVSALETSTAFFQARAARGNLDKLRTMLDQVPDDVAPLPGDER